MKTRIISAFPATGKTWYFNNHKNVLDSDSSNFSWMIEYGDKIRNPKFPQNYIEHIKDNIGKYDIILVSSHKVVRDALLDNCLFFYLIYPTIDKKDEFLKRCRERADSESFVSLINDNWEKWIRECMFCCYGCENIPMTLDNIENEINHIVRSEKGDAIEGEAVS